MEGLGFRSSSSGGDITFLGSDITFLGSEGLGSWGARAQG